MLFLLASLLSGMAPLPQAQKTGIYLTGLGALLTTVYLYGLIFRPRLRFLHMGIDSLVVFVLYEIGIAGLVAVAHGKLRKLPSGQEQRSQNVAQGVDPHPHGPGQFG